MAGPDPDVFAVRALAAVDIAAATAVILLFLDEVRELGPGAWAGGAGDLKWFTLVGVVLLPCLFLLWLGVRLWRFDRAAWALQLGLGLPIAALVHVGMFPAWMWLAVFAPILVLARRPARWLFGIGPDAVLADIDAREATTVAELATRAGVRAPVIEGLLARAIDQGAFLGAWDRGGDLVYSVDTLVTREHLRRCPRCGGALAAVGNLARCPYCATEFAKLTGRDAPMPAPIVLAVLRALDLILAYALGFLAVFWAWVCTEKGIALDRGGAYTRAWLLTVFLPFALAILLRWTALHLPAGRRAALILQGVLLPPAIPWLLRRRVRVLYDFGLGPLRAALAERGRLTMPEVGALLDVRRHPAELAVYLTASRSVDALIDWPQHTLVRRDLLASDGTHGCDHCGAPLRLGGWCAFCGTKAATKAEPTASPSRPAPVGRVVPIAMRVALGFVCLLALVSTLDPPPAGQTPGGPSVALVSAAGYDPHIKENFNGVGIDALLLLDDDRTLLSGEASGLFVWDTAARARTVRSPSAYWQGYAIHWIAPLPGDREFLALPYSRTLLRGTRDPWGLAVDRDLTAIHKALGDPTFAAITRDPNGHVLLAMTWSIVHEGPGQIFVHDVDAGVLLHTFTLPEPPTAVAFDPTGARLGAILSSVNPRLTVWDVAGGEAVLEWKPTDTSPLTRPFLDGLAMSPGAARIVTLDLGKFELWDGVRARQLALVEDVSPDDTAVFSPDGRVVAIAVREADDRHGVRLYDADTAAEVARFTGHTGTVTAIAFGARDLFVTGDDAGDVAFWSLAEALGAPLTPPLPP